MMPAVVAAAVMPAAAVPSVDNTAAQHRDNGNNSCNFNDFFHGKLSSFPMDMTIRWNSGARMQQV